MFLYEMSPDKWIYQCKIPNSINEFTYTFSALTVSSPREWIYCMQQKYNNINCFFIINNEIITILLIKIYLFRY